MKKTSLVLGTTAIVALAFLGSACEKKDKDSDKAMEKNSMEMMEESHSNDSMMEAGSMEEPSDEMTMIEGADLFSVDLAQSNLHWLGKKVTGEHEGDIKLSNGSLQVKDGVPVAGMFTIDMDSLTVTDIEDPESNASLVGHLKNEDFFGTEKHPTAMFELTACNHEGGENYQVEGNLTIKGITKPLSFPAKITFEDGQVQATGTITVDRTEYDIKYGSGKFFENIGDKAIDDTFTLDLDLLAIAQ